MFGIIDKTNNQNIQKTYTITQPHWSVSVRVNIYMLKSFAAGDSVSVFMDGAMQQQFQKGANNNIGVSLCLSHNDYLYQFYKNITHSANTFTLQFQSSISTTSSTGGYALSELYIEIDTCYPGCQTCSGPANNQCLTCISGAVANAGQCQCTTGFAYQTSCTQGNVCQDTLPSNGAYLLKALYQNFVSESEITGSGLTVTGLEGNGYGTLTSSGAFTSVCKGVFYIGGYMLAASNASFKRTFTGLPPHSQIRVGFTFVAIDDWESEYIYINYDGNQASSFIVNMSDTVDDLCGLAGFLELVFQVDKTAIHTAPTLNLEIHSVLSKDSSQKSYGLRNLFVIIIQHLTLFYIEGLLISDEFHLEMTASSIQGWPSLTIQCTSTDYVDRDSQKMYGVIDKTNNQNIKKTYSITQPHWSVSVRVNIYTLKSFASGDNIQVNMDGTMQAQYSKGTNLSIGKSLCLSKNDYLYQFYKNITHSANTFDLEFKSSISTSASTGGFALSELYVEIDTCYPGCQTCSGPAMDQCLTCITGAVANNGQCQCTTGFAYQTSCVSSCPAGLRGEPTLLICVQNYSDTVDKLCGLEGFMDLVYYVDKTAVHTNPTLNLEIKATLSKNSAQKSYGLRNLYVILIQCSQWCVSCNPTACLQCDNTHYLYKGLCYVTCPTTTYIDGNRECHDCDATCATCGGPQNTDCITCPPGKLLYNNGGWTCVGSCPATNYYSDGTTCQKCDASCLTCSAGANNKCLTCNGGAFFYKNQCLASCPSNTFVSGNKCVDCDSTCKTCTGPSNKECASCDSSTYLLTQGSQKSCVANCGDQLYQNTTNNTCSSCDPTCFNCSGPNPNQCTQCTGSKYLQGNQCQNTCNPGFYAGPNNMCLGWPKNCTSCPSPTFLNVDHSCVSQCPNGFYADGNTCKACPSQCSTCILQGASAVCTSCPSSQALYNGNCVSNCPAKTYQTNSKLYLQNNTCSSTCQNGTFPDKSTNKCQKCDSTCLTCSAGTNTDCLTCSSPNYLQTDKNSCLPTCKSNEYQDSSSNKCAPCNVTCATCSGPASTQCLTCQAGQLLYTSPDNKKTCINSCPDGYFSDTKNNVCAQCNSSCLTCASPGDNKSCLTCAPNLYLLNGQCVNSCPQKYYSTTSTNPQTMICKQCYQDCLTCSGPQSTDCKTCQLPNYFVAATSQCLPNCPPKFYKNDPLALCSACDPSCANCSGPSANQCTSCTGSSYLDGNSCVNTCSPGKFANQNDNTCTACDQTCKTCDGTASTNCLSCALPNYYQSQTKQCTQQCNSNQYKDNTTVSCIQCNNSCATCSGPNSNQCLSCNGTDVLINGNTCQGNCPDGQYQDQTVCKTCDSSCKTCVFPGSSNKCVTCNTGQYFYKGQCWSKCPDKTFSSTLQDKTLICTDCDTSCQSCKGPLSNNCLSCANPLFFNSDNTCKPTCSVGQYPNTQDSTCQPCDKSCYQCKGPNSNQCTACQGTSCNVNQFLHLGNTCVSTCPAGYYSNVTVCQICSKNCQTCNYPGDDSSCSTCKNNQFLYKGQCYQNCPNKTFSQTIQGIQVCTDCDSSCAACNGPTNTNCTQCALPNYLLQSTNSCVQNCPDGFYKNDSLAQCSQCDQSCFKCNGPTSNSCTACTGKICGQGYNLYNNACISNCPIGTYVDNQVCKDCNIECLSCLGPQDSQCTSCQAGMLLQDNYCVKSCDTNYALIQSQSLCVKCDPSCQTCTGSGKDQCATCPQNSIPFNSQCLTQCPESFYQISGQLKCNSCKSYCSKCTSNTDCQACNKGYVMLNGECLNQCPSQDYFVDASTNQCTTCHSSCKESGCFGPGENDCIVSYIEAKESILFIIFMVKLGYWIFNSLSGYFMDKFDENEHQRKVIQFMKGGDQSRTFNQSKLQLQTQEGSVIKRKNRNRFDDQNNLSATEQKNIYSQNNQTIQNISLNTSSYNQQFNNSKILNVQKVGSQVNMSPVKNQSWRDLPNEFSNINNQSYRMNDDSPVKTNQNLNTRRPIVLKRFSFKQDDGCPTFRDQEDQKNSDSQSQSSQIEDTNQPIDLPTNQKLYYSLIGNDLIQVWTLYNPFISRIFRATLVYFKFLCFFYATNIIYKKSAGLLVLSLILGMLVKEAVFMFFIQFAICLRKSAMIAVILLVGSVIAVCTIWFRPEIQQLTSHKDITWSWMYLSIFLVDFIFVQTFLALLRYFSSIRSLENRNDKLQALLDKTLVDQGVIYKIKNES
ncbi:hypothetical protein ABPG73_021276 [Tetrahymena malaccensis]